MSGGRAVLVTGAAGFVGRYVCAELRRRGVECIEVDVEKCDITDRAALEAVFRGREVGAVIHLAAVLPTASRANPELATRVNIVGGTNVIDAAVSAEVERFVFGSSMSVYGAEGDGVPVSEDCPTQPTDLYGAAKCYVEIYGAAARLDFIALRMATVVGPGTRNTASPWRSEIFDAAAARPIVIPVAEDAVLSLVHVEDVARMLVLLAQRDRVPSRIYNTPAENLTAGEMKRMVESLGDGRRVELDNASRRRTPPVSDGARFAADFGFQLMPLLRRGAAGIE